MSDLIELVCSARPKASVQKGAKGHQWWKKDTFHIAGQHGKTLCGINAGEWLKMEARPAETVLEDHHCCNRCSSKFQRHRDKVDS